MTTNALLESSDLPPFARIEVKHILPAVKAVLQDNRERLAGRLADPGPADWENVAELSADMDDKLERIWSPVRHLNAVANNPELREAYNACLPLVSEYHTELGHNRALYDLWVQLSENATHLQLDSAQIKLIKDTIRDFKLSGVDLAPADKEQFSSLQRRLSELQAKFEENVLDATDGWSIILESTERLGGVPDSAIAMFRQSASSHGKDGYRISLDFPSYDAIISYCDDRDLRRQIYTAYVTRASDQGPNSARWDNTLIMCEILDLRTKLAKLLGFENFAQESLATKMAESPKTVLDFLQSLADKSRITAEKEFFELQAFAQEEFGMECLESWDIAYATQKLREKKYSFNEEQIKAYFPVEQVIGGLFELVGNLFDVEIKPATAEIERWHSDVKAYDVKSPGGKLLAQFYVDLYAREHKRGGAWMDECRSHRKSGVRYQHAVAYLTCNSAPPVDGKPGLLTHDEVVTLFHEFGHGLHHMLTQVPYSQISGIRGVEWDAVELPSQFMENWCWQSEVLEKISGHYATGEKLPDHLRKGLLATRDFQAGMQMLRQVEFAMFDMRLHMTVPPPNAAAIQTIIDEVRQEIAVVFPPTFNRFQNGFAHIFGGGYAAGYYSYKWAEVLSADAFSRFEEEGLFNKIIGIAFLRSILEMGGSRPAMESFVEFRGREPKIDALLKHTGIAA